MRCSKAGLRWYGKEATSVQQGHCTRRRDRAAAAEFAVLHPLYPDFRRERGDFPLNCRSLPISEQTFRGLEQSCSGLNVKQPLGPELALLTETSSASVPATWAAPACHHVDAPRVETPLRNEITLIRRGKRKGCFNHGLHGLTRMKNCKDPEFLTTDEHGSRI